MRLPAAVLGRRAEPTRLKMVRGKNAMMKHRHVPVCPSTFTTRRVVVVVVVVYGRTGAHQEGLRSQHVCTVHLRHHACSPYKYGVVQSS